MYRNIIKSVTTPHVATCHSSVQAFSFQFLSIAPDQIIVTSNGTILLLCCLLLLLSSLLKWMLLLLWSSSLLLLLLIWVTMRTSAGRSLPVPENDIAVVIQAIRSDGENSESSNLEFVRIYNDCPVDSYFWVPVVKSDDNYNDIGDGWRCSNYVLLYMYICNQRRRVLQRLFCIKNSDGVCTDGAGRLRSTRRL